MSTIAYPRTRCNVGLADGEIVELWPEVPLNATEPAVIQHPSLFSMIDQGGASAGGAGKIVAYSHATTEVVSTTSEGNVISLTVPGGLVAAGDVLELSAWGSIGLNVAATMRVRVKFGATTVLDSGALTLSSSGNPNQLWLDGRLAIVSTVSQRLAVWHRSTRQLSFGPTIAGFYDSVGVGTAAEDTATDKVLAVSVQWSAASAAARYTINGAYLKHYRP